MKNNNIGLVKCKISNTKFNDESYETTSVRKKTHNITPGIIDGHKTFDKL